VRVVDDADEGFTDELFQMDRSGGEVGQDLGVVLEKLAGITVVAVVGADRSEALLTSVLKVSVVDAYDMVSATRRIYRVQCTYIRSSLHCRAREDDCCS
jgi:hypothetical protein